MFNTNVEFIGFIYFLSFDNTKYYHLKIKIQLINNGTWTIRDIIEIVLKLNIYKIDSFINKLTDLTRRCP